MQDTDFRDQVERLAKLIISLAEESDITYSKATYESREHWTIAKGRPGQIKFERGTCGDQLIGVDAQGPIEVALDVAYNVAEHRYEEKPQVYISSANLILLAIKHESISDNDNIPAHADIEVITKMQYDTPQL